MLHWQNNGEPGTDTRRARRADRTAVALGDFATDCQADARSVVFSAAVEPLEHREYAIGVLVIEADAVVGHSDRHLAGRHAAGDLDDRRHVLAVELESVGGEVLQELAHLQRVGVDRRELADDDAAIHLMRAHLQIMRHLGRDRAEIDGLERMGARRASSCSVREIVSSPPVCSSVSIDRPSRSLRWNPRSVVTAPLMTRIFASASMTKSASAIVSRISRAARAAVTAGRRWRRMLVQATTMKATTGT